MQKIQQDAQALLDQLIADGSELGLQLTIYFKGEKVVDAVAGIADRASGHPVDGDTLFPVYSTTKGMVATLIHLLVERGKIGYETPIAGVWPEFAAHGKGGITLRHALNHTAGLANMPMGITHEQLCDWNAMVKAMADQTPVSPPGMEVAYHAITYGWLLGEVARRVDGRDFPQLLHDEIGVPLKITTGIYCGLPPEMEPRVAILEAGADLAGKPLPDTTIPQAIPALVEPLYEWMNRSDARRACIPASNGIMTARAIAKHYAALLPGGVDGVELLPPERIRIATEPQFLGNAQPGDLPIDKRLGYTMDLPFSKTNFGHAGYGGSLGFADPASGVALGFTRNRFADDHTVPRILELLRKALQP
jgi:CubicO group peptidase (beta-lactamase class C family)